jgi:hypothetical protein
MCVLYAQEIRIVVLAGCVKVAYSVVLSCVFWVSVMGMSILIDGVWWLSVL